MVEISNDYYSPSDRRLKENIQPIRNALDKILSLQGVTYTWNNKATSLKSMSLSEEGKTQIGLIAQDVQKVFPELVHSWVSVVEPNNESNSTKNSTLAEEKSVPYKEEFQAVDYSMLSAVIVEAMREQRSMMEDLEEEIRKLEMQLEEN